ncbi:MAG: hypothetical protein KJ915_02030 [Candidatus Omnitrophica bacterium]|nr:hypothetical protein [Candidatus Omnitrophota bacterium]
MKKINVVIGVIILIFAVLITTQGMAKGVSGDYFLTIGSLRIDFDHLHGWKSRRIESRNILGCKVIEHRAFNTERYTATVDIILLDNSANKPLDEFIKGDAFDIQYNIIPQQQVIMVNGLNGIKGVYDYKGKGNKTYLKKLEAAVQTGNQVLFFQAKVTPRFDPSQVYIFDEIINSIKKK